MQPLVVPKQENCGYVIHRVIELLLFKLIHKNSFFLVKIKNSSLFNVFLFQRYQHVKLQLTSLFSLIHPEVFLE